MTVEYRRGVSGEYQTVMTECPVCGETFPENAGQARTAHLMNEHAGEI